MVKVGPVHALLRSVHGVRLVHAECHQGHYKESGWYMPSVAKVSTRSPAGTCRASLRSVQGVWPVHAERHQGRYKESGWYMPSVTKVTLVLIQIDLGPLNVL